MRCLDSYARRGVRPKRREATDGVSSPRHRRDAAPTRSRAQAVNDVTRFTVPLLTSNCFRSLETPFPRTMPSWWRRSRLPRAGTDIGGHCFPPNDQNQRVAEADSELTGHRTTAAPVASHVEWPAVRLCSAFRLRVECIFAPSNICLRCRGKRKEACDQAEAFKPSVRHPACRSFRILCRRYSKNHESDKSVQQANSGAAVP